MLVRILGTLIVTIIGVTTGCDFRDPCIQVGTDQEFGTDHLEKMRLVSNHVRELNLPTTTQEVAVIVGAAYAASQIEGGQSGVPVRICVRSGKQGDTEYRVLSTKGKLLSEWQSTATIRLHDG